MGVRIPPFAQLHQTSAYQEARALPCRLRNPSRTSALNLALIVPLGASVSFSASDIVRDPRAFTHSRIVRDSLGSALANLFHALLSVPGCLSVPSRHARRTIIRPIQSDLQAARRAARTGWTLLYLRAVSGEHLSNHVMYVKFS